MRERPPKLPEQLLTFFCRGAFIEDLLGDLEEMYEYQLSQKGRSRAKRYYWWQAIRLLFSYSITKRKRDRSISTYYPSQILNTMLTNYIKISVRNILKNKTFSILNIFGLGIGMSIGLLGLAFFVELNLFEQLHENPEEIYRVTTNIKEDGNRKRYASVPTALTYMMEDQLTGIESAVHINDYFFPVIKSTGEPMRLSGYHTEPTFLDLFNFPLVSGTKKALNQPGVIIITHEAAEKLFGDKPAMGQSLETENWGTMQVGGVLAPFPKGTHFNFDLLMGIPSNHGQSVSNEANWTGFTSNYFYFKSKLSPSQLEAQIATISQTGKPFFDIENIEASYEVQSILDINPDWHMEDTIGNTYEREALWAFFGMTVLILIPACLNYGNMAVANALKRSKEIGIRKIMGSPNKQIINQFLVETVIICLTAILLSIFIFDLIRTELLRMMIGGEALNFTLSPRLLIVFFLFAVFTGILTGLLPAIYFSKITPIKALRNVTNNQKVSVSTLRKALLVFQFVLSLVFMIGIGVLVRQYHDSLNFDQGFERENVLVLPIKPGSAELVTRMMETTPAITGMSLTSSIPGIPLGKSVYFYENTGLDSVHARVIYTDEQFIDHMNIEMVWGNSTLREDQFEQVLVNETLMSRLANIKGESTDTLIAELGAGKKVQIVGIIKDYNHEPLSQRIEPMVVRLDESQYTYALFTVNTDDIAGTMNDLEDRWDRIMPNSPFQATFLNSEIEKAYYFFITGIKIFAFLAILAVTISCLGLLGMVIFTTENRRKEVAIRKTLGAGTMRLLYSLSGLFFRMWVIALFIAVPLSYLYYDRVMLSIYNKFSGGVGFSEIAVSCLFTLSLGMLAIMIQSTKVMRANPAESLRSD